MARSTSTTAPATWQDLLAKSEAERKKADKSKSAASSLLWQGAQAAIGEWLPTTDDVNGETLYSEVMSALGGDHRKGDASKVRTVALAVKNNGLVLDDYANLSQAYAESVRRTKETKKNEAEDEAAEAAIEALDVPTTTRTVDGAAAILLSKGIDGAVVAILDALGKDNADAHRSFLRAVSTEISARVTAKAQAEKDAKDAARKAEMEAKRAEREAEQAKKKAEREAEQAKKKAERETAAAEKKAAAAKALAERKAAKATPAKKGTPVKTAATKAKPKGAPVKKAQPKVEAEPAPVESDEVDDLFDEIEDETVETPQVQTNLGEIKKKGAPVKRPARV